MFLLVGGDSEIGAATHRLLQARGQSAAATTRRPEEIAPDRPFLDLTAPIDQWTAPPATRAACIFAAIARIASCHDDPIGSARVNVDQTLALIEHLVALGIHVLFLSTNQVFDGTTPNVPAAAPHSPVSEYGRQKAQVEAALCRHIDRGAPVAILRLAKVVSPHMALINGWIEALSSGLPIQAFDDMRVAPTPIELVTGAIARVAAGPGDRDIPANRPTRCHLCGHRPLSGRSPQRQSVPGDRGTRPLLHARRLNALAHHARFAAVT